MKFFIIDDDVSICRLLALYLAKHARCFHATHGSQAMRLFNEHLRDGEPFDAVFMDIEMPGFKGHDVAELFRQAETAFEIPKQKRFKLFMVSAHDDLENVSRSFHNSRAVSFIKKPFSESTLDNELKTAGII